MIAVSVSSVIGIIAIVLVAVIYLVVFALCRAAHDADCTARTFAGNTEPAVTDDQRT